MGIPGLTHFLDTNNSVLEDVKLSDLNLIIDGSNVVHFLYYYYKTSHVFGGDYKVYAEGCRHFFETLQKCKVVPYVILDGAYHPKGKKFSSSLNRIAKRATLANEIAKGGSGKVLPLLSADVFIEVLKDLGISCVFCNFEADYHIASLAALWKCPVLTNDSDFFIFDLPGGVILLDYLNVTLETDSNGSSYLNAQVFYSSNLAKWSGITEISMLPLFATLMGNDVVDGDIFQPFCKKHDYFSKVPGVKLKKNERRKIPGLLKWLAMKRNYSSALDEVVFSFHADRQKSIRELVEKSVGSYTVGHTFLFEYFKSGFLDKELENVTGPVPQWFHKSISKGLLPPRMSNAFVSHRCILLPQVESFKHVSSNESSLSIRQRIYAILLKSKEKKSEESLREMREFDRNGTKILKKVVKVEMENEDSSALPHLMDIPSLHQESKLSVILDLFHDGQRWFLEYPCKEQLFLASLSHWVNSANPKVEKYQALSFLVYFYAPAFLQKLVNEDDEIELLYPVLESTISIHLGKIKNRIKYFDINQIHNLSQFQSCFQYLSDLNKLLLFPLHDISATKVFNATSLSYICHHLESAAAGIWDFVSAHVEDVSTLEKIKTIWTKLGFSLVEGFRVVKKKQKKKLVEKVDETPDAPIPDGPETIMDAIDGQPSMLFNVEIENKFSQLLISDNQ